MRDAITKSALALAMSLMAGTATAEPHRNAVVIYTTQPPLSCGQWIEERKINGRQSHANEYWVMGFVSAFNIYAPESDGLAGDGVDSPSIFSWIDQRCKEHPLEKILVSVKALVEELNKKR